MTQSFRATSWLIVSCGGVGSRAPWRSWDDGGRHGRWVRGFASFHLGTLHVRCQPSIKSRQRECFNSYIETWYWILALPFLTSDRVKIKIWLAITSSKNEIWGQNRLRNASEIAFRAFWNTWACSWYQYWPSYKVETPLFDKCWYLIECPRFAYLLGPVHRQEFFIPYEIKPYCEALETFLVDFIPNLT